MALGEVFFAALALMGIAPGRQTMPAHLMIDYRSPGGEPRDVTNVVKCVAMSVTSGAPDVLDVSCDASCDASCDTSRPSAAPVKKASTRAFVKWWRGLDDVPAVIPQRMMLSLYHEFCDYHDLLPLSDRQLLNKIKSCGVEKYRPPAKVVAGRMHRPTIYRLKAQGRRS